MYKRKTSCKKLTKTKTIQFLKTFSCQTNCCVLVYITNMLKTSIFFINGRQDLNICDICKGKYTQDPVLHRRTPISPGLWSSVNPPFVLSSALLCLKFTSLLRLLGRHLHPQLSSPGQACCNRLHICVTTYLQEIIF